MGVNQSPLSIDSAFDKDVFSPLPSSTGQVLQDYPGVQIGANVHVSDLAYTDGIVILSSSYWKMHNLLEAVNRHAAGMQPDQCDVSTYPW